VKNPSNKCEQTLEKMQEQIDNGLTLHDNQPLHIKHKKINVTVYFGTKNSKEAMTDLYRAKYL
jgi:hypothetical protein